MAINPETRYAGKIAPADAEYPYGKARDVATPGDGTGTPWQADLVNDLWGWVQSLLDAAGIVPTNVVEKVGASQYLDALRALLIDKATTDVQSLVGALSITLSLPAGVDTADAPEKWPPGIAVYPVSTGQLQGQPTTFGLLLNVGYGGAEDRYLQLWLQRTTTGPEAYIRFGGSSWSGWQKFMFPADVDIAIANRARQAAGRAITIATTVTFANSRLGPNAASWEQGFVGQRVATWNVNFVGTGVVDVYPPQGSTTADYVVNVGGLNRVAEVTARGSEKWTITVRDFGGVPDNASFDFQAMRIT